MKLLLHACCGPCSLEPVRLLREAGHELSIAYMNSNIHPQSEYEHRLTTLRAWADKLALPVVEGFYNPDLWEAVVGKLGTKPRADRCQACYRFRFNEACTYAAEHNFDGISTTLSVSPYQFTDIIQEELQSAGRRYGLEVIFEDFRPYYQEATRRSRELEMYRQNYCGCHFSEIEAATEREERKRARKAKKQQEKATTHNLKNSPDSKKTL